MSFVVCTTNIQSNYYRTNFFLADYEKHRGGLPCGRRREASEERHPTCLSVLAFANIVTYLNVYSNNVINEKEFQFVAKKDDEKQNIVKYGDVLFTLSSETPEEVGIGSVYLGKEEVYLNSFCFGIHITKTKVAFPPYLSYYVASTPFRKFIYPYAQGSTRFNLCKANFEKASIILPSLENQKRIYSILKRIAYKIETEKSLLGLYNSQKLYMLCQMFI